MTAVTPRAPRKLPIWSTVGACYTIVFGNLRDLAGIGWLWLLIMLPVYAVLHWLTWPWATRAGQRDVDLNAWIITLLPNVIELPALASIAVAWHRLVLRGERVATLFYVRFDHVVWRYVLALLVLLALITVPLLLVAPVASTPDDPDASLLSLLAGLAMTLAACVSGLAITFLLVPRISLVLPALALGESLSAAVAWRATRGNTWRLASATLLCALPPIVLGVALWHVISGARTLAVVVGTASSLVRALVVTVEITLLSLAYRHLVDEGRAQVAA